MAAYLGSGKSFDKSISSFAETYADQNERGYDASRGRHPMVASWSRQDSDQAQSETARITRFG